MMHFSTVEASHRTYQHHIGPPTARVPVKRFKFRVGAKVLFHGTPGTVIGRSASWYGRQIYTLDLKDHPGGIRYKDVMGCEFLKRAN
ncbi:hypothetical protein [Rhizobium sp. Root1220]|uniref:hypothetical protein n=1 Tax=Rhizobium sp. Root1220 TaxID=1736432 RepID=UPI0006F69C57|nr:hypothetical protein [Rhizobium sp. Root1220]KQV83650.1 hypothetical protein ASC90_20415 [Rhizobium sp. Root1220]